MNQNQVLSLLSSKDINNYSFIKMLGTESYSEVFQGKNKRNGEETAIKVIDKVFLAKQNKSHLIYLESNALMSINHPEVIKCYATYESNTKLYLSLELMNCGTFRDYIKGKYYQLERYNLSCQNDCHFKYIQTLAEDNTGKLIYTITVVLGQEQITNLKEVKNYLILQYMLELDKNNLKILD
ncbi:unnamed protein product [Paramecium sonneborni]|uniref:non-specific serine/threonine protein kinase n=1 Tax=Paramecium sonneborni TaxID=65129 RepID=A0A8S1PU63_9CILI|nr:unnamed protein product [Paramecium sonneborni]